MLFWIRMQIGKRMLYWGYRILPPHIGVEVSGMVNLGLEWFKAGKPQKFECELTPKEPC